MANTAADTDGDDSGVYGIVSGFTHLEDNTSKNVSSVTIKTNAIGTKDSFTGSPDSEGISQLPAENAQEVVNVMVKAGVQGILNFSPAVLQVPEEVTVNNVDLALELENLNYFIKK